MVVNLSRWAPACARHTNQRVTESASLRQTCSTQPRSRRGCGRTVAPPGWIAAVAGLVLAAMTASPGLAQNTTTASNNELYKAAIETQSLEQMNALLQQIVAKRSATTNEATRKYLQILQAWLLHRRGETHFKAAAEAVANGQADARRRSDALALQDFDAAIKLDPDRWKSYHHRGVCYAVAGRFEEALRDFSQTVELQPDYATGWSNRGEVYYELGDMAHALADYGRAIELRPDDSGIRASRGHAYFQLRRFDQALEEYSKAVELDPENVEVYTNRGEGYRSLGEWERAAGDFRRAINLDTQFGRAYQCVAWLMATCPNEEFRNAHLALRAAEKAVQLDGDDDYVYLDTLAAAYANNGNFEQAAKTIRRAIQLAPADNAGPLKQRLALYSSGKPFRQQIDTSDRTARNAKRP